MASEPYSRPDPALYPGSTPDAAAGSAVSLSAIFAGTIAAIATTLMLVMIGSAFGLASVSPWPGAGASPTAFTTAAGIWLIVTQWLSSAIGGYMAGRLRTRWHGLHTDEVFFRDTAHGFLTWALATVVVAIVAVAATSLASLGAAPVDPDVSASTVDAARRAAANFAAFGGLSLVIGAFVGSASGAIGGRLRDLHP